MIIKLLNVHACPLANAQKGRAVLDVVPTLKEIDTPRDLEALSSQEIRQQVAHMLVREHACMRAG